MIAAVVLAMVGQGIFAFAPIIQRVILDDAIVDQRRALAPWLVLLFGTGLATMGCNYLRRSLGGRAAVNVQRDLQVALHQHLQHLDAARHDQLRTGDIMSRVAADTTLIQLFLQQLSVACGNLAQMAVSLVLMLVLSPVLALVLIVCVPLFLYISVRFRNASFPASWMDQRYVGAVAGVVEEAVTGVRVVKAFGQEAQEQEMLDAEARQLFQSRVRTARITARYNATLQAIPTLGQLGILALGGWLAMSGDITIGVFLAFSSYVLQLVMPVRMLSGMMSTSQQARAGAQRVLELLDVRPVVADLPDAKPLESPRGAVALDHVSFAYEGGPMVLDDITLQIAPGERVAIVGGSGSGKSTLALLFGRFYEASAGSVLVDGHDVRAYTLDSLRRAVGMVFDDSFLFASTIRDNIAFGRPDASDDDVERAAAMAQAHDFITALPLGYDTVVGERGFTLSGGQRQRIALARAALANPKVLILDDATSAIDAHTEAAIHKTLRGVMDDRTTILIAHRPSTLKLADRIIVIDGGRITAQGTIDELLISSPHFQELLTGPAPKPGDGVLDEVAAIDATAWPTNVSREGAPRVSSRSSEALTQASAGGGHGAGAAGAARLAGLSSSTSALLAAVDRLPPLAGDPEVDVARATAVDESFTFRKILRPFRAPLLVGATLVLIDAVTSLAAPVLIRYGVDGGVVKQSSGVLRTACLALLAVQLLSWGNAVLMTMQTSKTAERMLFSLRVRTFAHLQRLSLDYYDRQMAGRIMTRMTSDVEAFAQLLQQGLLTAMVSLLSCAGVAIVLIALDPFLALAVAAVLPPLAVGTIWFRRSSGRSYLVARQRVSSLYADFQESLAGVRVTQSCGQQATVEERFRRVARSYRDARVRSVEAMAVYFPFLQFLHIGAKTITLAVAASQVRDGNLSVGVLIAFLLYLDQFFLPMQQLSMVFDQWLQAGVAVNQLSELLRTPTKTPQILTPVQPGRLDGRIRFDDVEFSYASTGLVVMEGLTLEIAAGETVALVGTTGAGKSTLVKLVGRFYDPTSGRVLIDDTPLTDLDLAAYRHQLGYVPQEPFLFSGTIRTNIAYGRPDASDLEVERAARAVGAHDFVRSLPFGYHTPVSEQGRSLSSGQRQLLCLARAHLVDPAILLLDEATANLDLVTEAKVQRAMGSVARGRTTILIAHRLQTARVASRILVVEQGRIVEDGSHEDLIECGGRYAELWSAFLDSAPADDAAQLVREAGLAAADAG